MKTFGKFAKTRIGALGKSQKVLADQLNVSPAYISQIFTGKKHPPDLGKPRNRMQLKAWCEFLDAPAEEILDLVRYELHRVPPKPEPKYRNMRETLLSRIGPGMLPLLDEIRTLEQHPAENRVIDFLTQIFLVLQDEWDEIRAYSLVRFKELCLTLRTDRSFVENTLSPFFSGIRFSWKWNPDTGEIGIDSDENDIFTALERLSHIDSHISDLNVQGTVPVVGHVSAGDGFQFTDGGFFAGEGFEQVPFPPGLESSIAKRLYCVRVRGDSLREFSSAMVPYFSLNLNRGRKYGTETW